MKVLIALGLFISSAAHALNGFSVQATGFVSSGYPTREEAIVATDLLQHDLRRAGCFVHQRRAMAVPGEGDATLHRQKLRSVNCAEASIVNGPNGRNRMWGNLASQLRNMPGTSCRANFGRSERYTTPDRRNLRGEGPINYYQLRLSSAREGGECLLIQPDMETCPQGFQPPKMVVYNYVPDAADRATEQVSFGIFSMRLLDYTNPRELWFCER